MMKAVPLDFAQTAFETFPSNETAGVYLVVLMEYYEDAMISEDELLDAISKVAIYLNPKMAQVPDPDPDYDDQGNLKPGVDHK